jgi:hypothetical protein
LFEKIHDKRAFLGAVSLLLVGAHLSVMMGFYFIPGGEAFELMQARWWWELSLNLQILCLVLMALCHWKRVRLGRRWRRRRAMMRMFVGIAGITTPTWVLVIGSSNNWFKNPPTGMDLAYYAGVVWIVWFVAAYLAPLIIGFLSRDKNLNSLAGKTDRRKKLQLAFPFILLLALVLFEQLRGGWSHIILWPLLTYAHASVSYLQAAFKSAKENCD